MMQQAAGHERHHEEAGREPKKGACSHSGKSLAAPSEFLGELERRDMTDKHKRLRPSPDVPDRPQPGPADQPSTTEQLRADIDRGQTRDKVPFPDPAAAPLGTDAEAAGTPTSPEALASERRQSVDRPEEDKPRRNSQVVAWLVGLLIAALAVAGIAVFVAS